MIVDDNPMIRDLMCRGMEPFCAVISSPDGADALLKSIDNPPDLIISDFRMPGLDGRQLFEKLRGRENTKHIPFVFVASRGDIEEKLRPAVGGGVEDFIPKPFFVANLVSQVKKIVDRLHLEKMQKHASRPGVIQGRLPRKWKSVCSPNSCSRSRWGRNHVACACAMAGMKRSFISAPANVSMRIWAAWMATQSPTR